MQCIGHTQKYKITVSRLLYIISWTEILILQLNNNHCQTKYCGLFFFFNFRKGTVFMYVAAYQGHMQSLLCVMLSVFILCQTMSPSVKEQPFMYLILLLTEHYSKGEVMLI